MHKCECTSNNQLCIISPKYFFFKKKVKVVICINTGQGDEETQNLNQIRSEILMAMANILFSPPSDWVVSGMTILSFVSIAKLGYSEIRGTNLKYSKFFNSIEKMKKNIEISGRNGMLIAYLPAFLAGVASFFLLPDEGLRVLLVKSALSLHFFKRLLEVILIIN